MADPEKEALARRLVETYSDQLLRLSWSLLGSLPDAQDICQEVLLKRLEHSGGFPEEGQERAWLVRVTINACKNLRRSFWRRRVFPLEEALDQPVFQPEPDGLLAQLQTLSQADRQVLVLYYYMGYSTEEMARILSIRPDAARTRLSRARARLKQRLEADQYEAFL